MTDPTSNHWTEDEELLEQYILGLLPADRKAELDLHLGACEPCSAAVAVQEELIGGIRRFGRDELKTRLATRVARGRQRRFTWYRYSSVAAVTILVILVGIRNEWWLEVGKHRAERRELADSLRPKLHGTFAGRVRDTVDLAGNQSKNILTERSNPSAPQAAGSSLDKRGNLSGKQNPSGNVAVAAAPSSENVTLMPTRAEPLDTISFWLQGAFLAGSVESTPSLRSAANVPADAGREEGARLKGLARISQPARGQTFQPASVQLSLDQRPRSEYPQASLPNLQIPRVVPALLKIAGPTKQLTLFVDSLFTPSQFLNAQIEKIRPDSIVLIIGGRRIGCRVPPGIVDMKSNPPD